MATKAGAGLKNDSGKSAGAGPARAYATHGAELNRPHIPGESAAEQKQAAEGMRWVVLAALGLAGFFLYVRVWPALHQLLMTPSPERDWLLPPSTDPLCTIAGVGVGWFWLLFIAAPAAGIVAALLGWAMLAWSNHHARAGHNGHLRAGQQWVGEQYPAVPIMLVGAAVDLAASGVLLRWSGVAAQTVPGRVLVVALLCAGIFGVWQLAHWAHARGRITAALSRVTFLVSPTLGWPDLRAGRVKASRCHVPRRGKGFPGIVTLHYSQHPRSVGDDMAAEAAAILLEVIGQSYTIENQSLTRTLVATHHVPSDDTQAEADVETVLAPLVAFWFDAAAQITSVVVADPAPVVDDGKPQGGAAGDTDADLDAEALEAASATTANDVLAERIMEFTVGFVASVKVSSTTGAG